MKVKKLKKHCIRLMEEEKSRKHIDLIKQVTSNGETLFMAEPPSSQHIVEMILEDYELDGSDDE